MQLGMVGLGRMGSGMTKRLEQAGHEVKTYDPNVDSTAKTLRALAKQLETPRHVWLMVPSGKITEDTFQKLLGILEPGDTIVDGGNSNFRDSQRRYAEARKRKVAFVDVGVSGGVWGLEVGFCLMAGGDKAPVRRLRPVFEALAPEDGFAHVGPSGAGHFVKMVHNGIEYGLMQAYAEGFELMYHSELPLDLSEMPDDVRAAVDKHLAGYEQRWVDESIPALNGLTPRQALDDPTRREDLFSLLREMRAMTPPEGAFAMSVDRLEGLLGIDQN